MLLLLFASIITVLASTNATNLIVTYKLLKVFLISIELIGIPLIGTYAFFRFKENKVYEEKEDEVQ